MPSNKVESVRYLASLEKRGLRIQNPEGSQWRLLSEQDLIKLAQDLWHLKQGEK